MQLHYAERQRLSNQPHPCPRVLSQAVLPSFPFPPGHPAALTRSAERRPGDR
ncbi:Uncharacterised protein [Amycolatopsis camponoti]|uniref:Uncharacterized protein n=1 Tax=Amycolatopsis camponoti TaxID=2606593 RepID=A0A6I8LV14_9PSEU|nr:Uncharacterised protein [Amycolatopsis camponoti]